MWPFKVNKWSLKQKMHRRLCRQEEQELERLVNTMWPSIKTTQERFMTRVATHVPTPPQEDRDGPFEGLGDDVVNEFENNGDPKGDACCVKVQEQQCSEPRCPCHANQPEE